MTPKNTHDERKRLNQDPQDLTRPQGRVLSYRYFESSFYQRSKIALPVSTVSPNLDAEVEHDIQFGGSPLSYPLAGLGNRDKIEEMGVR